MRLVLIRHGQVNENIEGRYLGHFDAPLNKRGIMQASNIAKELEELDLDVVYSSDLIRASHTAIPLAQARKVNHIPEKALRELDFGKWDMKTYEEIMALDKIHVTNWIDNPFFIAPPNGETLLDLGGRVDAWLESIINIKKNKTVAVVSHGGPIRWFQSKWIRNDQKQFWNVSGIKHGEFKIYEL